MKPNIPWITLTLLLSEENIVFNEVDNFFKYFSSVTTDQVKSVSVQYVVCYMLRF